MKPLTQRSFLLSDIPAALALWRETPGIGLNESDTPEALTIFLQRNPGFSRVVEDGGEIVAAVLCGHDGRRGYLHHLAVRDSHRGRGIGRSLVDACLGHLQRFGLPKCTIMVFDHNGDGEAFWRKHDWQERTELKVLQRRLTVEQVA